MINVNQLTQQLRMLPDAALQRVAQMYKQDPYIFPMVISEGMARKKLRAAGQAQAAAPQPKVNDQAVASLGYTPEEVGIGALQAPNMQGMADGGIAGQADEMEFVQRSEPVVRMADGGAVARYADEGLVESTPFGRSAIAQFFARNKLRGELGSTYGERIGLPGMFTAQSDTDKETAEFIDQILPSLSLSELQALKKQGVSGIRDVIREKNPELFAKLDTEARSRAKPPSTLPKSGLTAASLASIPTAYETIEAAYGPDAERMPQPPMTTEKGRAAPGASTRPTAAGVGVAGAPGAARPAGAGAAPGTVPARPGEDDVAKAKRAASDFFDENAVKGNVEAYVERTKQNIEAGRGRVKTALAKEGKAYEGLEALLQQEGVEAKKGLNQDKAMAILNAGLAMMAGTSPRALENIGKGAMVGTGQYAEALKDFKKAAKERQRATADIEQARRAEARDDTKTMLAYEQSAEARLDNAEAFGVQAIMGVTNAKAGAGVSILNRIQTDAAALQREREATAARAREAGFDRESRERMGQLEIDVRKEIAQMPGPEAQMIKLFGSDPTFRKSFEEMRAVTGDQKAASDLVAKIVTTPGALETLKQTNRKLYDSINTLINRMTSSGIQPITSKTPPDGARP